ncbi:F-box/kelch-repeat protein, partial [Trifolium medium]|nr:F-box/kelch-repeat protein [Trifolium medium]
MEPSSKNDVPVDVVVSSPSPLPTLPFDLIGEILCRLPVKLLLQFQCVCKFWKSLISDPSFAKKHLCKLTPRHHLL